MENTNAYYAYIGSNVATRDQVLSVLEGVKRDGMKKGLFGDVKFNLNYITNRMGKHIGICYLQVTDPRFVHVLVGNNVDGSERTTIAENKNWKPLDSSVLVGKSWADMYEEEMEHETTRYIKEKMMPLVNIAPVKLVGDQRERLIKFLDEKQKVEEIRNLGDAHPLKFKYLEYKAAPEGHSSNVLICLNAPDWVDDSAIYRHYKQYTTTETQKYPMVRSVNKYGYKIIKVIFAPGSNDAYYAMTMSKFVKLQGGASLAFTYNRLYNGN
ncbi:Hypothetical protein ORPV_540 [Orpheovirus IHUMI-LCC2]|uniref:Uncharacterized protein n=1 Tax=Orpheovirus IHUMI-LCC2 TaxID=2023057 RepID=A0A2I2L4I9_9VIRU|nr:Hypothetical protein ORPV_540 [Orpheovirus IHUMI-LCC2]SNW62444.1 Hypothetical protein ORPV_540 [Orpheovirus IHUMI-LCC2]